MVRKNRTFLPRKGKEIKDWRKLRNEIFIICNLHIIFLKGKGKSKVVPVLN